MKNIKYCLCGCEKLIKSNRQETIYIRGHGTLVRNAIKYFWSKVKKTSKTKCWIWFGAYNKNPGYGKFQASYKIYSAHRFSYEFHFGIIKNKKMRVLHKCDNTLCVNPNHLFLGTDKDNVDDCVSKDRHSRGERNGCAILIEENVQAIYSMHHDNLKTISEIAKIFKVSYGAIYAIVHKRNWKHLNL